MPPVEVVGSVNPKKIYSIVGRVMNTALKCAASGEEKVGVFCLATLPLTAVLEDQIEQLKTLPPPPAVREGESNIYCRPQCGGSNVRGVF